ncbi:biotin--protein ligase [Frateuria defendens]|uniref:biotin--protein ligase n=1 Tax=Frateuria defendens TaxID=2219559 RepID=UPI001F2939DB|nr:biotin--protein ligase [Frateuria defendens]
MPGGKLVVIDLALRGDRLADVQLSGDFFLEPDHAFACINAALQNLPAATDELAIAAAVHAALPAGVRMYGLSPEAVAVAVRRAVQAGIA